MNSFLHYLDVASLLILWWAAITTIHSGHKVRRARELILQALLIGLHAFALIGAISLVMVPRELDWALRGVLYPVAGIAAWLYDYKFGICRHVRLAIVGAFHRERPHG